MNDIAAAAAAQETAVRHATAALPRQQHTDAHEIVTDPQALFALRDEWNALCARAPGHYLGQTCDWARLCWESVARPRGDRLVCLIARRDGRIGLIWPLVLVRRGWAGTVARPLDSQTSAYTSVLVEESPDAEHRVAAAWRVLAAACDCDAFELNHVRSDSVLGRVLATVGPAFPHSATTQDAPWVAWDGYAGWTDYMHSRDARMCRTLARKRRRLATAGNLQLRLLADPASCAPVVDWLLERKRSGLRGDGFAKDAQRSFLLDGIAHFGPRGQLLLFTLELNGNLLAAELDSMDGTRLERLLCADEPRHATDGAAQLLHEDVARWAFERGLDYDFRAGSEPSIHGWCNRLATATNYTIANSALGTLAVRTQMLRLQASGWVARLRRN